MSLPDLAFAASAGMLATINPCAFPLLPGFAAYFVGAEGDRATEGAPARILRGLVAGLTVAVGFAATFAVAAVVVAMGGKPLLAAAHWLAWIVAGGLIVLGFAMLAGYHMRVPLRLPRGGPRRRGLGGMLAYGVASLSCTLPIFLLVVGSALTAGSAIGTVTNFLVYALGMAVVLVAVAISAALGQVALAAAIGRLLPHFQRLAGALVTAGGIWLLYVQASTTMLR